MKATAKLLLVAIALAAFAIPAETYAGKLVIEKINVIVKQMGDDEFALHFQFSLVGLPTEVKIENLLIDYAELSFGVQVITPAQRGQVGGKLLEILAATADGKALSDFNYNVYPAIGHIRRKQAGTEEVKLDITRLVEHWVKGGVSNHGLLVASHRNAGDKAFRQGIVELLPKFKPTVTIFYTVQDE
ncbi:MAG: hypothetical protein ONB44_13740 [candidate division KSB1 bacterium]|nr:hypothetical protein [candidate division KSB1 bacterium]MDZ7303186.1 hypothetical protein [candidate division KSB1 bacterium]MDZ7310165.1 hypothetical protein [candidate division KSB1 bacterium]